uniref:Uncharacterized protein n=1 Tax=Oryza glaberrima TaxID=4538 RepID=I1P8Y6_ORYGL
VPQFFCFGAYVNGIASTFQIAYRKISYRKFGQGDTYEVSSDTYKVSDDSYHVLGDTSEVSGVGHQSIVAGGPTVHVSRWSLSEAAASSTVHATSELGGDDCCILHSPRHVGARHRRLRPPSSTSHVGASCRWPHPPPYMPRQSSSPAAASSVIHAPRRSSSATAASSIVHTTSELVAGGRVLLSLRLSTPTIAPSPAIATTHVHQLRLQARTAPQRGTSLRFSNDGQAPRAAAVVSWCE